MDHLIGLGFGVITLNAQPLEQVKQSSCKGSCISRGDQKCKQIIQIYGNKPWPKYLQNLEGRKLLLGRAQQGGAAQKGDDRVYELGKNHSGQ